MKGCKVGVHQREREREGEREREREREGGRLRKRWKSRRPCGVGALAADTITWLSPSGTSKGERLTTPTLCPRAHPETFPPPTHPTPTREWMADQPPTPGPPLLSPPPPCSFSGAYPETVAVNLWGLDAIKTKGESVGIVLHLVGAR